MNQKPRSKTHSNAHQSVFIKESDKYQWLVLEQKSQCEAEVRQTDNYGTITARDNYKLTGNFPKCVGVERLCEGTTMQIPFNADEINLIYQLTGQDEISKTHSFPKSYVFYRKPRSVSTEQRNTGKAMSHRFGR